ncbi:DeoR/GlpR family DNA-binding transcription regulator [Raineyella fluvialis]|nr:DeoR/GlpR family DNA-binding transcription regulator [Raineyella fluvialis]
MSTPHAADDQPARTARRDVRGDKRRARIVELVSTGANVAVADLAEQFGVSLATIRRDLSDLEERKILTRTYGGAALARPRAELDMLQRGQAHAGTKRAIGARAAGMVEDDDLIILDAGSTTEQVALALDNRPVTVVTNGLRIIVRLVASDNVKVLVLGGSLRGFNETIHGADAEAMLRRVYARYAFVGADAIHPRRGVASRTYEQARLKSLMMESAAEVVVVSDSSKLGDSSFNHWSPMPPRWTLITDQEADPAVLESLRGTGADVVLCGPEGA